jgi:hypothetical protein
LDDPGILIVGILDLDSAKDVLGKFAVFRLSAALLLFGGTADSDSKLDDLIYLSISKRQKN